MLERDLQDYLFDHPEVLFGAELVANKRREVFIEGRRIDLLFEVGGVHYIVELKRDTIRREDIGQIFEYYGLMRRSKANANFRMILAAPNIPDYRRIPLEEFGIRCVEVVCGPQATVALEAGQGGSKTAIFRREVGALPGPVPHVNFLDFVPPATPASMLLVQGLVRTGLVAVQKTFPEYEVVPVRMVNYRNPGVLCFPDETREKRSIEAGAWWAFSFGHSEEMPKNDVPNVSVNALPWGLDFAINAELRSSQEVMRTAVGRSFADFDRLVQEHGGLEFQAWLKIEHQPRIYHWILLRKDKPMSWRGCDLFDFYARCERDYETLRTHWIGWLKEHRTELSAGQVAQMERTNRRLNLALRLVSSLGDDCAIWRLESEGQQAWFEDEYKRLKPLIDFFQ